MSTILKYLPKSSIYFLYLSHKIFHLLIKPERYFIDELTVIEYQNTEIISIYKSLGKTIDIKSSFNSIVETNNLEFIKHIIPRNMLFNEKIHINNWRYRSVGMYCNKDVALYLLGEDNMVYFHDILIIIERFDVLFKHYPLETNKECLKNMISNSLLEMCNEASIKFLYFKYAIESNDIDLCMLLINVIFDAHRIGTFQEMFCKILKEIRFVPDIKKVIM